MQNIQRQWSGESHKKPPQSQPTAVFPLPIPACSSTEKNAHLQITTESSEREREREGDRERERRKNVKHSSKHFQLFFFFLLFFLFSFLVVVALGIFICDPTEVFSIISGTFLGRQILGLSVFCFSLSVSSSSLIWLIQY